MRERDRINTPADFRLFLNMCHWVKENTSKTAHFLAPPVEFNFFRKHARRGLVCSFKGRGWAAFSAETARKLKPLFDETKNLYNSTKCDVTALVNLAHREGADYIIIDKNRHDDKKSWKLPLQPKFQNSRFVIYKTSDYWSKIFDDSFLNPGI